MSVLWQPNITKKQQEKLETLYEVETALHILIMNVEAFSTDKGMKFAQKFLSCHNTLMAIDESTSIKNPMAKRTKNILALASETKYRRIMTGSPVTKNPLDLFSQCYFLDPFHLNHESYYSFRMRYAVMKTAHIAGRKIQLVAGFRNLGDYDLGLKEFYRVLIDDGIVVLGVELDWSVLPNLSWYFIPTVPYICGTFAYSLFMNVNRSLYSSVKASG